MFMKIQDIAKRYSVSVSGIRRWVRIGIFPQPIRIGNLMRWDIKVLEDFEKQKISKKYKEVNVK